MSRNDFKDSLEEKVEKRAALHPLPLVIGISGPPRAGKDTFCGFLHEALTSLKASSATLRMSHPLKLLAAQMLYEKKWASEALKDTPFTIGGTTYRTLQIGLFSLGAQLLGPDWLGQHYIRSVHYFRYFDFLLMPDCGRPEEVKPILDMEIPFRHVIISRADTTYEGDSRVHFETPESILVENNSTLAALQLRAKEIASELIAHRKSLLPKVD